MTLDDEFMDLFKKKAKKEFVQRDEKMKELNAEQKKKVLLEFQKHYKEQMKKPLSERWHFKDEWGYEIIVVRTHEKPRTNQQGEVWNQAVPAKQEGEYNLPVDYPLLSKPGEFPQKLRIKAPKEFFFKGNKRLDLYGYVLVLRGEMYVQYKPLASNESYFRKEFLEVMNKLKKEEDERKGRKHEPYTSVKQVDASEYIMYFTFRVHQHLAAQKYEVEK